jgi:uncharacterized damage-inducible protein DinB
MKAVDVVRRMHEHRMWVNRCLLAAAEKLSPEQLEQACAIGQGTIWKSLVHMWAAEYVWLAALQGEASKLAPGDVAGKLPGNQEAAGGIQSLTDLQSRWNDLDTSWRSCLAGLNDAALDDVVQKVRSNGQRFAFRRNDVLLHVCTHAHYTAAQTVNMLRQVGAGELPDLMVITLARSEPPLA